MAPSTAELLQLIERVCTVEEIQELLRDAKKRTRKRADVRVSATDGKEHLVRVQLADALNRGFISSEEAFNLIREAEENGNQHIFYFRPKVSAADAKRALSIDRIGAHVVGRADWATDFQPTFNVRREQFGLADLRRVGGEAAEDWVLKLYGHETVEHYGDVRFIGGQKFIPVIDEEIRIVLVIRWRSAYLLEMRVQRNQSRRRVESWLSRLWKTIEGVAPSKMFSPWDLTTSRRRLLEEQEQHRGLYSHEDIRLYDPTGDRRTTFEGRGEGDDLFSRAETQDAVRSFLGAGDQCTQLAITWHVDPQRSRPSRELPLLVGARGSNEVVIRCQCGADDVDYVTEQLRRFGR